MRSSTTCRRRGSGLLVSTALLLTGAHARNLRRSSSSSVSYTIELDDFEVVSSNDRLDLEDERGFEVIGGGVDHEPVMGAHDERMEWHRSMLQEEGVEEEQDIKPKEYINDETLSFVDPNDFEHNRMEKTCASDEMLWTFRLTTDAYGYETSWMLEKKVNDVWTKFTAGPPGTSKYHDNTLYRGATCLQGANMYKLTVMDARNDGICCSYGKGTYSYQINGVTEYDSSKQRTFTDEGKHAFYVGLPVPKNNGNGNSGANQNSPIFLGKSSSCGQNKQKIGIKFIGDNYAGENSWELKSLSENRVIKRKGLGSFEPNGLDMTEVCVKYGKYQFTLTDGVGDGICCGQQQGDGRYEIYMDDERIIYGSDFTYGKEVKHTIHSGYHTKLDSLTQREVQYLNCHNWRRKKYHEEYGATYVPLKYDLSLQDDAQHWADELLKECHVDGIKHEPGVEQGENLAKNMGSPRSDYGKLYPVENICRRWFEREVGWKYPDNAHLTQGLWRSAHYVGCAESSQTMQNGGQCHVQVCRYARAGNCNMGQYKSNVGENWKVPLVQDHNPCGPICPPNGCH